MKTRDFSFELPEELIAQKPTDGREDARLLVLDREGGTRRHARVSELPAHLRDGSLLVLNDTRVRKARFDVERVDTRGSAEFLLVEKVDGRRWWAITNRGGRARVGLSYRFPDERVARIIERDAERRLLEFDAGIDESYLERHGAVPLPPYIRRSADSRDAERYQTVYARTIGSVAAPTAGLHFTEALLARLSQAGIETRFLTLHVGLGTFAPVRTEEVEKHSMHAERFEIPRHTADAVNAARAEGRPVVAVGTTSVRALESAATAASGSAAAGGQGAGETARVVPGTSETSIFIYPGYRFRVVDALFTNFHTPESTLIMLVAAFAGRELILDTYREAVEKRYRFFSYGDAMLIR
ncbi:MAG: tRNA preQ1(34) S-adenosylmethionine ribosyltransferase-isomerase QueA [Spirochaetaceae bacterium]